MCVRYWMRNLIQTMPHAHIMIRKRFSAHIHIGHCWMYLWLLLLRKWMKFQKMTIAKLTKKRQMLIEFMSHVLNKRLLSIWDNWLFLVCGSSTWIWIYYVRVRSIYERTTYAASASRRRHIDNCVSAGYRISISIIPLFPFNALAQFRSIRSIKSVIRRRHDV